MKRLPLTTLLLPAMLTSAYNPEVVSRNGFAAEGYIASVDTIVDLSDLPGYGKPVEWKAAYDIAGVSLQTFGDRWMRYERHGDTLLLTHRETAREFSDFSVPISASDSTATSWYYIARSRRDMSFVFSDSGTVSVRRFVTPLLILADGDTVRDCPGEERVFKYLRRKGDDMSMPSGMVCDTETLWGPCATTGPLAASFSRHIRTARIDGVTESRTFVFPRDASGEAPVRGINRTYLPENIRNPGAIPVEDEPAVGFGDREISISSPQLFDYTLCDISGRVVKTGNSVSGTVHVGPEGLPAGEYVVHVRWESGEKSVTVLVK